MTNARNSEKYKTAEAIESESNLALRQALERKLCGKCKHNCKLSDTKCIRGEKQAKIAAKTILETHSSEVI
jgi:predicted Ser/Thr protein kinase